MAFTFSLAAVLALRQQRAQQEERALAAILSELAAARDTIRRIEEERGRVLEEMARLGREQIQGVTLHERYARLNVLEQGMVEMQGRVAEIEVQRAAQQQIYLEARRDRDLLDELRGRQHAVYVAEANRREQKRLDDLFLARRLRV